MDKFPQDYGGKVTYHEDPYFFNDWYGYMYYCNDSEKRFLMEKKLSGCKGLKVVNYKVKKATESILLEPGEHRIYLLKRTSPQVKFIPAGKVHQSPAKEIIF